jgi:hypothetical protein
MAADPQLRDDALPMLSCLTGDDPVVAGIRAELASVRSPLELMKRWIEALRGAADNDAPPYRRLRRLFELGAAPERIEGHHYGLTLGLRTGDLRGAPAHHGNVLGYLWGETVGGVCPWVGKSFAPIDPAEAARLSAGAVSGATPAFLGVNHFHLIEKAPLNVAANAVLGLLWGLEPPPAEERSRFGHQRNGGRFLAYQAPSVWSGSPRTVFRLNYRFAELENAPPLPILIDEVVELAPGLYLGQLLFATARILASYSPAEPDETSRYQHFGYFALFDARWNAEAMRLFPHLGMPDGALPTPPAPPGPAPASPAAAALQADLATAPTLLHLLRRYADALRGRPRTDAPEFAKLDALFAMGKAPRGMSGFFHGASLTFQSQGLLSHLRLNGLNVVWELARHFSPWTGKRFDPIDGPRLAELTDGREVPGDGVTFGSNTVVFRSWPEKLVRKGMHLAHLWMIDANEEERRRDGYDARTFFFIGKPARSIVPESAGQEVYQFNYRWRGLRTPPPDNLCVDEIVEIADGLHLGKLLYATNLLKPWDPDAPPREYDYRLFGYFLLMDPSWHALRLELGFDLDDT